MKKLFLIKYGEIALKGKNKNKFINALVYALRSAVKEEGDFSVEKKQGRIVVRPNGDYNYEVVLNKLRRVFGVVYVAPVYELIDLDFENVKKYAKEHLEEFYGNKECTFKVVGKRADKRYELTSMEIGMELGAFILDNFDKYKVDVKTPEIKLYVEIRKEAYIYSKQYKGPGGMPMGTNGKASLLLSGGIDSPVAGWMVAKRGVEVEGIYFHSHPYTSDRAKEKVVKLAEKISNYTGGFKLHVVPFTDVQLEMMNKCRDRNFTIIMRRIMYMIAERIAKESGSDALITGESIGQVASQTIDNLVVTNDVVTLPVFRPLIAFDKVDVINVAKEIDTYETSILPYEDCCTIFVAKHTETRGKVEKIKEEEANITNLEELIQKAIDNTEIYNV